MFAMRIFARPCRAKISLAFIFYMGRMRALPLFKNLLGGIGSSFSDLSLARIQSRLSKKLIKKFWVFRLATMFYAPVYPPPVQRVVLLPALTLGNCLFVIPN